MAEEFGNDYRSRIDDLVSLRNYLSDNIRWLEEDREPEDTTHNQKQISYLRSELGRFRERMRNYFERLN